MNVINNAFAVFPHIFGAKLRAQRETIQATLADPAGIRATMEAAGAPVPAGFAESDPMPEIAAQMMSYAAVSEMLGGVGVSLSADDLAAIEAGTYPNLDARLMLALMFLLEFSIDAVLFECLQTATSGEKTS